ncbi:FkbM family methyltransferase [Planktomarina temperata]|nr:FkbM family methyltransferase [Planktomarina temperata]
MKKHLICFADNKYRKSQRQLIQSAKEIGNFDLVHSFSEDDFGSDFLHSHQNVLAEKQGFGLWAWKPYFLLKVMQIAEPGDFIFYADAGSTFVSAVDPIVKELQQSQKSIGVFELSDRNEYQYTKGDVFDALDCNDAKYAYSKQIMATFYCCFNIIEARHFLDNLLQLYRDKSLLDNTGSLSPKNFIGFIEHRHDQSVLSLMAKKSQHVCKMSDPSQWGNKVRSTHRRNVPEILWVHRQSSINGVLSFIKKIIRRIPRILNFMNSLIVGRRLNKLYRRRSVSIVQQLLSKYPKLYAKAGSIYHYLSFLIMFIELKISDPKVKVLLHGGGDSKSQYGQDNFLISQGLIPKSNGIYLEVGANHPVSNSNTYQLATEKNYRGISLDPLPNLIEHWSSHRPQSVFLNLAVSDNEGKIDFLMVEGNSDWEHQLSGPKTTASIDSSFSVQEITVDAVKLSTVINKHLKDECIDVLFIDVEGHELNVLKSNDWEMNRPTVVVIENGQTNLNKMAVRTYLTKHGYKLFARIWLCEDIFIKAS